MEYFIRGQLCCVFVHSQGMLISGLILVIPAITTKDAEPVNPVRDHRDESTRPFASDNRVVVYCRRRSAFEHRDLPGKERRPVTFWDRDCEISRINPCARLASR